MRPFRHSLLFSLIFVTPLAFAVTTVQTGKNDQKQVSLTIYERDRLLSGISGKSRCTMGPSKSGLPM